MAHWCSDADVPAALGAVYCPADGVGVIELGVDREGIVGGQTSGYVEAGRECSEGCKQP